MKICLLPDAPNGWIVERIAHRMAEGIEGAYVGGFYTCMTPDEVLEASRGCDVMHFQNWNAHVPVGIKTPVLVSVRSHRFPPQFREQSKRFHVHVVSPELQREFPGSHYIPDGIDEAFYTPFRVGYAGQKSDYKGCELIRQACAELGVDFIPAFGSIPHGAMPEYYRSLNVLVCASEQEGFGAPIAEACAMGLPVVSTDVGVARRIPGICRVSRTVAGIRAGIERFYLRPHVEQYRWSRVCEQFKRLYGSLCAR